MFFAGRRLRRLLLVAVVFITINIICYRSYKAYVLNAVGREMSDIGPSSQLTGIVPSEIIDTILDQPKLCAGAPFNILICVKSTISNVRRRQYVRNSWASQYGKSQMDARVVFVVGKSKVGHPNEQQEIEAESSTFQDIIQGNFTDAYKNITLKSVFLLSWAREHCSNAKYFMSADDDTLINPENLVNALKPLAGKEGILMGIRITDAKPYRHPASKWYASYEEYKDEFYPPFLTGSGYVMSKDVLHKLQKCTLKTSLFHLDDVFVTGICAKSEGIVPQYHKDFTQQHGFSFGCFLKDLVTSADMPEDVYMRVWTEVIQRNYYSSVWCLLTEEHLILRCVIFFLFVVLVVSLFFYIWHHTSSYIYELFLK